MAQGLERGTLLPASRPHRVLLIESNIDGTVGGSHQAMFDLVRNFDRGVFEPVALYYQDNRFAESLRSRRTEVHVWDDVASHEWMQDQPSSFPTKLQRRLGAIARRVRFVRAHRIALVHINNSPGSAWFDWLPASRLAGIPCIAHARSNNVTPVSSFQRLATRHYARVIAISNHVAKELNRVGVPTDEIQVVYDGIDEVTLSGAVHRDRDSVRRALGIDADKVMVAMVGHLRPWKGQHVVLEGIRQLRPELRDRLVVLFVGGTAADCEDYARALRDNAAEAGLDGCVRFLGERTDVPELMSASDVVLHASTVWEPFGLVVLEGMMLGKAVIASCLGGPSEVINEGSGILFDPRVPSQLTSALESVITNEILRSALADRARQRGREFSARRMADQVQEVYRAALAERGVTVSPERP
jgi:glycosyltransferase involved in cell wall biosynthesis